MKIERYHNMEIFKNSRKMIILPKVHVEDFEPSCFSKLWNYYHEKIEGHEPREIPISFLIIKLMNILKRTNQKDTIAIALLITISFLHKFPAGDIYDNRGINFKILPESYKKKVNEILRREFLMN